MERRPFTYNAINHLLLLLLFTSSPPSSSAPIFLLTSQFYLFLPWVVTSCYIILLPDGDLSLVILNTLSSVILLIRLLHYLFLPNIQSFIYSTFRIVLIPLLFIWSLNVFPIIFLSIIITVVSSIFCVLEGSGLVSALYAITVLPFPF